MLEYLGLRGISLPSSNISLGEQKYIVNVKRRVKLIYKLLFIFLASLRSSKSSISIVSILEEFI